METDVLTALQQLVRHRAVADAKYDDLIAQASAEGMSPTDIATAAGISYSAATKALRKVKRGTGSPQPVPADAKFGWTVITLKGDREPVRIGADSNDYQVLPTGALRIVCTNGAETVYNADVWEKIEIPVDPEWR